MSEKEVLSREENNIPLEGGQAFPLASYQEVGVGSAQTENRGEEDQPEPNIIQGLYLLPPDSPNSNTNSPSYFSDQKNIEGDDELDSDKYPLPASEDAEPTVSREGDNELDSDKYPLPASEDAEPALSRLITATNYSSFGLSSDCHECTQVEPMVFIPSVGNKVFRRKVCLHKFC